MKIVSYVTHTPHQYDIANALYDSEFYLVTPIWATWQRPMPSNVHFVDIRDVDLSTCDVALVHSGGETPPMYLDMFEKKIPIVVVCHGGPEPFMSGYMNKSFDPIMIAAAHKNLKVVHCCEREMLEWQKYGMQNGTWIWHGMKDEFIQCQYREKKPIIINAGNYPYMNNVPLLEQLHQSGIPWLQKDMQVSSFDDYKRILSEHNVFVYGARFSSFPRTRAEAMHAGMCVVTTNNWDEDKFIKDGENGFIVANDYNQIKAKVDSLDMETIEKIGKAGQATAKDVFGLEKYRQRWLEVIGEVKK